MKIIATIPALNSYFQKNSFFIQLNYLIIQQLLIVKITEKKFGDSITYVPN